MWDDFKIIGSFKSGPIFIPFKYITVEIEMEVDKFPAKIILLLKDFPSIL